MDFIPKYIKRTEDKRAAETVKNTEWNALFNLLITQGDHNSEFLNFIANNSLTTEEVKNLLDQKVFETGSADMCQAVYDKNRNDIVDIAETVVENSIEGRHIQEHTVTTDKLSQKLNDKLDYLYSNVGKLLVLIGAQAEIEGTADLVLFGLDGTLNSVYNAIPENISVETAVYYLPAGTKTIAHNIKNITELLNKTDLYSVTDDVKAHKTKLTEITNATMYVPEIYQIFAPATPGTGAFPRCWVFHLEDDYYCILVEEGAFGDTSSVSFVVRYDESSDNLTVINSFNIGQESIYMPTKMNNYVYFFGEWEPSLAAEEVYRVTKSGTEHLGQAPQDNVYTNRVFGNTGYTYYITSDDKDPYDRTLRRNDGRQRFFDLGSNVMTDLIQVTGKYAFLEIQDLSTEVYTYYWLNLETGGRTSTDVKPAWVDHTITDPDGIHLYYNNAQYVLNSNTFEINKIKDITGIPAKSKCINNGIFKKDFDIYKIKGTNCEKIYSLAEYNKTIPYDSTQFYPISDIAVNTQATKGIMLFSLTIKNSKVLSKPFKFTQGKITLAQSVPETLNNRVKINRQQIALVPANSTKQIFLKPKTNGNPFTELDLIIYTNRATTSSDKIEVIARDDATNVEAVLSPLPNSGEITKYYEHTFSPGTSNIEIIVTVKAGNEPLRVTNILGGVDNGI